MRIMPRSCGNCRVRTCDKHPNKSRNCGRWLEDTTRVHLALLRAWARRAKVVLDLIDYDGKRSEVIVAPEDSEVLKLCERVGYGAVMDSAARQWFAKDGVGAHTVGPCALTVRDLRADLDAVLDGKSASRRGGRR